MNFNDFKYASQYAPSTSQYPLFVGQNPINVSWMKSYTYEFSKKCSICSVIKVKKNALIPLNPYTRARLYLHNT